MVFAKSLKGTDARLTYPAMGALMGESFAWQLWSEDMKSYNLKMSLKYLTPLWEMYGEKARIELRISKDVWWLAAPAETGRTIQRLAEKQLLIKGLVLEKMDK